MYFTTKMFLPASIEEPLNTLIEFSWQQNVSPKFNIFRIIEK